MTQFAFGVQWWVVGSERKALVTIRLRKQSVFIFIVIHSPSMNSPFAPQRHCYLTSLAISTEYTPDVAIAHTGWPKLNTNTRSECVYNVIKCEKMRSSADTNVGLRIEKRFVVEN